jgi:hemerythrin superfamily protein
MDDSRDAVDVLESDHRAVEVHLWQLEQQAEAAPRRVLDDAVRSLSVHSAIEVELLYPFVADTLGEQGVDMAKKARLEHEEVEMTLLRLQTLSMSTEEFRADLSKLIADVRSHVQWEETMLFPQLRASGDADKLRALAGRLEHAKRHAPTRPHPHAPKSAAGAKVADRLAHMVDRMRDRRRRAS